MPLPPPAPPRAHTPLALQLPLRLLALAHCDLCGCAAGAARRLADAAAAALLALAAHRNQMQSYFELKQQTAHLCDLVVLTEKPRVRRSTLRVLTCLPNFMECELVAPLAMQASGGPGPTRGDACEVRERCGGSGGMCGAPAHTPQG